jgi:hypothetical protein
LYLIRRNWAAFFGAAVFARLHPIATETVTYSWPRRRNSPR